MSDGAKAVTSAMIEGLSVRCFGDPGAVPVIFSPGLGGAGAYWKPQIDDIARAHRVILYDHRGTGSSSRAPLRQGYTVDDLATEILCVLDGLGIPRAHVVGHAAGGIAGLRFAQLWPGRAQKLTIVNGWAKADRHFTRCFEIRMAIYDAGGPDAYLKAQPLFLYPSSWINDHLDQIDEERAFHAAHFQDRATLQARISALRAFDAEDDLAGISTPTLVVVSEDDMLVPPNSSVRLYNSLPHAALARFSWGGHAVNVTDPEGFNRILLGFLSGDQA